jgi:hypothetical protein
VFRKAAVLDGFRALRGAPLIELAEADDLPSQPRVNADFLEFDQDAAIYLR